MNQIIGLTLYVIIPYAAWVLTTGLLFNKIKSPLIYNLIIHLLYVSSVLFIGFKTAQNTPPVEALTAVAAGSYCSHITLDPRRVFKNDFNTNSIFNNPRDICIRDQLVIRVSDPGRNNNLKCPRCGSTNINVVKSWQLVAPIPDARGESLSR